MRKYQISKLVFKMMSSNGEVIAIGNCDIKEENNQRDHCHADSDGDCHWEGCPQLKDGEPKKTSRPCPYWILDKREEIE
jgi:hypothetical protein